MPPPPPPASNNPHALQNAIDAANPGDLLVLSPGVYNENVLLWKPLKLQGLGPGGIIGAHELQARDPEDPRFHVVGSVVDGRYFAQNATAFDATVSAHAPYAGVDAAHPVLRGADLTVAAKTTTAYNLGTGNTAHLRPGPHRRPRPDDRAGRGRRRHPAPGPRQQLPAHQQRAREQRRRGRRRDRARPAVRPRQPQLQRPGRQQPAARQRRPDPGGRARDLLRLQQLRRRQQHRLLQLQRELRRRRLPHRPQPRRRHPRQPDLLQRLGRLRGRHRHRVRAAGRRRPRRRVGDRWTWTGTSSRATSPATTAAASSSSTPSRRPINIRDNHDRRQRRGRHRRRDHARRLLQRADHQQHGGQQRLHRLVGELRDRRAARRRSGLGERTTRCSRRSCRPAPRTSPTQGRCSTTSSGTTRRSPSTSSARARPWSTRGSSTSRSAARPTTPTPSPRATPT